MQHFEPSVRHGVEVTAAVAVVYTIVEFYGVVPVVYARKGGEAVVARGLGGKFHIVVAAAAEVDMGSELLPCDIVEVVVGGEKHLMVVAVAEVFYSGRLDIRVILAADVVGHEVDDHAHAGVVCTLYKSLELVNAARYVYGEVGVDVVVVGDGVGAAGMAFDYVRGVARYAVGGVVGVVGVLKHTGIPHVCGSETSDRVKYGGCDVVEFARTVDIDGTVYNGGLAIICKQARQQLVDDWLYVGHVGLFFPWGCFPHPGCLESLAGVHVSAHYEFFDLAEVKDCVVGYLGSLYGEVAQRHIFCLVGFCHQVVCAVCNVDYRAVFLFLAQRAYVYAYQSAAFVAQGPSGHVAQDAAIDIMCAVYFHRREDDRYRARGYHPRADLAAAEDVRTGVVKVRRSYESGNVEVLDIAFVAYIGEDEVHEFLYLEYSAFSPCEFYKVAESLPGEYVGHIERTYSGGI